MVMHLKQALDNVQARQQAMVADLGLRALGGLEPQALMEEAARAVGNTLALEFVEVLEVQPDGTSCRRQAGLGWRARSPGPGLGAAAEDSLAAFALEQGSPILIANL